MSTAIAKQFQIGSDSTATNNFTIRQPATPDGTVRIANGNSGTTTDLVTVTSAGNVGVGTTSPSYRLQAASAGAVAEIVASNSAGAERIHLLSRSSAGVSYLQSQNSNFLVGTFDNYYTAFITNNTERMRLDNSGNLGIGTSSPAQKLDVVGTIQSQNNAAVNDATVGAYNFLNSNSNAAANPIRASIVAGRENSAWGAYLDFYTSTGTSAQTAKMRLDTAGNLGLGVTPSADWASSSYKAFVVRTSFLAGSTAPGVMALGNNAYNDGAGWKYVATGVASYYVQNAGAHSWSYAPSGTAGNAITFTQAMTLDASGNLGINSTSPSTFGKVTVQVAGTTTPTNLTNVGPSSINLYAAANGGSTDSTMGIFGWNSTTGIGSGIGFVRESSSDWGTQIRFYTHPTTTSNIGDITERARITSGGNFGLGTTNPVYRMQVQANANTYAAVFQNQNASPYGIYINHNGASPNNAGNEFIICWDTTAIRFRVNSNGGIENYQANNVNLSDRREKTNFAPAGDYLSKICAIPVQTFNYIDQNMEEDPGLTLGVVAQDVQAVAPELVSESNWGTKEDPKMRLSIYQTDLQYALMKCIQELKAELDSVKTELALLKGTA